MCNKGILGGKIANAVDIHQEVVHLVLQPVMMPILFLMKSNQKLSVIRTRDRFLGHGAVVLSVASVRAGCGARVVPAKGYTRVTA